MAHSVTSGYVLSDLILVYCGYNQKLAGNDDKFAHEDNFWLAVVTKCTQAAQRSLDRYDRYCKASGLRAIEKGKSGFELFNGTDFHFEPGDGLSGSKEQLLSSDDRETIHTSFTLSAEGFTQTFYHSSGEVDSCWRYKPADISEARSWYADEWVPQLGLGYQSKSLFYNMISSWLPTKTIDPDTAEYLVLRHIKRESMEGLHEIITLIIRDTFPRLARIFEDEVNLRRKDHCLNLGKSQPLISA